MKLFRRVTQMRADEALRVAVELHRQGHLPDAEGLYVKVLEAVPEHPDALHFLGVLRHRMGRGAEGVELIRRSLALAPRHADAHNNLGNILKEQGRLEEAEESYRRAVALAPRRADFHNNLGVALKGRGRLDEAVARFEAAIDAAPDHADAHHNLAVALKVLRRIPESVAAARRAIALRPDHSQAHRTLADTLLRAGRRDEAVGVLEEWLRFAPDHPVARHLLAAYRGEGAPERASDAFVRQVFDEFAATYDTVLETLDYHGPALVAAALTAALPPPARQFDVLDAGCGTGLCGPPLRPWARRLVGVDLSTGMIERARGRGVYDELMASELVEYLRGPGTPFDVVASVDTLNYIGNLRPLFAAAFDRLRCGGWMVFTVERAPEPVPRAGYRLEPSGRYSHSRAYLDGALVEAGLKPVSAEEAVLRREMGSPVAGLVMEARRP